MPYVAYKKDLKRDSDTFRVHDFTVISEYKCVLTDAVIYAGLDIEVCIQPIQVFYSCIDQGPLNTVVLLQTI